MKVIMQIRPDIEKYPGGDYVQLLKTREYLQKKDIKVDISHSPSVNLKDYDIVHLFNVTRITDTYLFFQNARRQNKRIVLSSIYHPLKDMQDFYRYYYKIPFLDIILYLSLKEIYYPLRSRTRFSLASVIAYKNTIKEVLSKSHMLLPNSHMEFECIERELHIKNRYRVIPNAAELGVEHIFIGDKEDSIVCVGRIEPRKNQNAVIKAFLKGYDKLPCYTKLIFIGALNRSHKKYCDEFLRSVSHNSDRVKYLGPQPHDRVIDYFKKARLSVLASFFETTGLVGLEALSCGANVVITERGYTREYFGTYAVYCDPYSTESISGALVTAFYRLVDSEKIEELIKKYSWENAALLTAEAYKEVLADNQ